MTMTQINPVNVDALVVGIESYAAGDAYDLNGPAQDALEFARWLIDRGVTAEAIQLMLSPLDQNADVLANAEVSGLTPKTATRDNISRTVSHILEQGGKDKLLYVFWAGHGFITKLSTTTRRLFFADTDTQNKWNLDFDSLLQALQTSKRGTVFPQQVFFVDACANPIFRDFYPTIQAEQMGEGFATSGIQGKAEQYALFAAAEYEVATNLGQAGTGRFSRAVLNELSGQSLVPNVPEMAIRIKQNFQNKKLLEPVFWSFSIGGSDREVVDRISQQIASRKEKTENQTAGKARLTMMERLQLINTLNGLPLVQFEVLVRTLDPPAGIIPPNHAEQGLRSSSLLSWIEGPTGPGLNELKALLGAVTVQPQSDK